MRETARGPSSRSWAAPRFVRCSYSVYLVVPPGGAFREPRRIELGPRPLSIGRAESCDVRLDVPGVDNEHAKVSEVALIAMGPDCAIGDVPLEAGARRLVMPGDEIQIGSVVLALEGHDPSLMPPPPDDAQESPVLGHVRPTGPRVRVVEGSNFGEELVLAEDNKPYVIGRAPKCDLVLEDREVSREHVKIVRKGFKVFLHDASSTRGSWIGRAAVYQGSTVEWTRPRMLKLGATVLSLELPEEARKNAPQAQASAGMTPPPRSRGLLTPSGRPAPGSSRPPPAAPSSPPSSRGGSALDPTPLPAYAAPGPQVFGEAPPAAPSAPASSGGAALAVEPTDRLMGGAAALPSSMPTTLTGRTGREGTDPAANPRRTAWKKNGTTMSKGAGVLLLLLAGFAILGAILVVFSLME